MTDAPWTPCLPPPKPPIARQHCRHYGYEPGLQGRGPLCAAGVDMSAPGAAIPCMPDPKGPCPKREDWTAEERAAWKAWSTEHRERLIVVITAIPDEGYSGQLPCPGCGVGTVTWSRARSNNHLHAGCSTPHCFRIMQ